MITTTMVYFTSLLVNIFMADWLFILNDTEIANYADDNTPYPVANYIDCV